jgi:DNA-binding NarL/FixJ family response regulator
VDQNQNPISEITTPLKSQLGESSPLPFFERILAWFGPASPQIDPQKVLSERELKIFRLLGLGKYNWEIAFRYFISVDSIDAIIRTIARKLRVSTRDLQRLGAEFNRTADEPMD